MWLGATSLSWSSTANYPIVARTGLLRSEVDGTHIVIASASVLPSHGMEMYAPTQTLVVELDEQHAEEQSSFTSQFCPSARAEQFAAQTKRGGMRRSRDASGHEHAVY